MERLISMLAACATLFIIACDGGVTGGSDSMAEKDSVVEEDSAVSDDPTDSTDQSDPTDQTIDTDTDVTDEPVTDDTTTDNEQPDIDTAPGDKYCYRTCSTPDDCVDANPQAITDADNYTCDDGICVYKGCNNSTECETTYQSTDYGCNTDSGYGTPTCVQKCSVAGDCVSQYAPLPAYDDDNYLCTGQGFCKYLGCNTDQECVDTMSSTGKTYGCFLNEAIEMKFCEIRCSTYLDCGSSSTGPAYTPDRYTCENQRCIYHGCDNAQQCIDSFSAGYDCREP
ncbi:MAG TPA: hypothetical protein PLV42_10770 [bacterium]|nr:hypothetical protein [bacterium]